MAEDCGAARAGCRAAARGDRVAADRSSRSPTLDRCPPAEARDAARSGSTRRCSALAVREADRPARGVSQRGRRPTENEASLPAAPASTIRSRCRTRSCTSRLRSSARARVGLVGADASSGCERLRDLALVRAEPPPETTLEAFRDDRRRARRRCGCAAMPDARREYLVPRAMHVKDEQLPAPPRDPLSPATVRRGAAALVPRRGVVPRRPGSQPLGPFLEKGRRGRRSGRDTGRGDRGRSASSPSVREPDHGRDGRRCTRDRRQAALAIDNARLYSSRRSSGHDARSLLPGPARCRRS